MVNYIVKVRIRGEGVSLGHPTFLGGRYQWLSFEVEGWLTDMWLAFGVAVAVNTSWTELAKA